MKDKRSAMQTFLEGVGDIAQVFGIWLFIIWLLGAVFGG